MSSKADDDTAFESTEILVTHNGASSGTVASTAYGTVTIGGGAGGSPSAIASYAVALSGDNLQLTIDYNQVGGANKDFTSNIHWIGLAI